MAKVKVYITTRKAFDVEIDDDLIRLDINQWATKQRNDTVYMASFVDDKALTKTLHDLEQTFCLGDRMQGYDSVVSAIEHPLGVLYEE